MKEVIIRFRDDPDRSLDESVATYTFSWIDGKSYEIDLSSSNVTKLEQAMQPFIKVARESKSHARRRKRAARESRSDNVGEGATMWAKQIAVWAADHGYDWGDKAQRDAVRNFGIESGLATGRSGIIPRRVMEAYHAAQQQR